MDYHPEAIRTVALVGHAGCGKTSLIEALLHRSGAIHTAGSVERGTTVCDFDALERRYHHSLNSAVTHLDYCGTRVYLVDTPGYPDFCGLSLSALAAVETAAIVVNARTGIEMSTRRMMAWAKARKLCTVIIVNGIDGEKVDLPGLVEQIQEAFGKTCLPINLPAQQAQSVVDCFFNPSGDADFMSVQSAHDALVDQVIELDADLMELYLGQGEAIQPEQLHAPFEQALREGHLVPILFTSAATGQASPNCWMSSSACCQIRSKAIRRCSTGTSTAAEKPFRRHPMPTSTCLPMCSRSWWTRISARWR